jgi:hypothetical protein
MFLGLQKASGAYALLLQWGGAQMSMPVIPAVFPVEKAQNYCHPHLRCLLHFRFYLARSLPAQAVRFHSDQRQSGRVSGRRVEQALGLGCS